MEQPLTSVPTEPTGTSYVTVGASSRLVPPAAASAECAVLVIDDTGQVVSSNLQAQRLLSLSAEELRTRYCQRMPACTDQAGAGDPLAASVGSPLGMVTLVSDEQESVDMRGTTVCLDASVVGRPLTLFILDRGTTAGGGLADITSDSLAGISHEVRTPLCAITGYLDLLLEQYRTIRRGELAKVLGVLRRSARWLEHSVDNMVTGLNIFAGRFQIAPTPIRLADLIDAAVGMVDVMAAGKRQSLEMIMPEGHGAVWADRQHVVLVLANLLTHAIKQAPRGGRVTLAATSSASHWQISVSDNGPEAPWWQQEHFEARGGAAGDAGLRAEKRTLGVAVARYVVELHGGSMGFSSSADKGNTIWFTLPSAPAGIDDVPSMEPPQVAGE